MIPGQAQQFFEAAAAQAGGSSYEIERSLRFNSGDSAYLNKTLSSGNRRTWTLSFWVKRWNQSSTTDGIFCAYNGSISEDNYAIIQFGSNDRFYVTYAYANYIQTNRVFRDPSSWYHIVVVVDTNNSTAGDRVQLYVNGVRETDFAATHDPDAGQELAFNQACPHYIGSEVGQFYSDCYYAEMHFVDGTALGPTDFGEFDVNNTWNAKEYSGSYGTNGFYLKFNDNSSASALGTDSSGNSNTWTVNNLSVSAGVDNDSLLDSPTDGDTANDTGVGGQIPGNYCVINNLGRSANNPTVSDGNLKMVLGSAQGTRHGTMGVTSGKWYFEVVYTAATAFDGMVGVANKNHENNLGNYIGGDSDSWGYYYNGQRYHPGQSGAYGDGWTTGDVIGIALDMDNGALYFSKNGTYQNSGDPTSGASQTGAAFTNLSGTIFPGINGYGGTQYVNFGQRPFNTSAPSGYKTWNTANLPTPAIAVGATAFDAVLWTANNGNAMTVSGLGFSPDLVWGKGRSYTGSNAWYDTVRGATKYITSNGPNAEGTIQGVTAFTSDGFTLGSDSETNYLTNTLVGWCWDAGTSDTSVSVGDLNSSAYNQSQTWSTQGTITNTGTAPDYYANTFDATINPPGASPGWDDGWRIGGTSLATGTSTVTGLNIAFTSSVKIRFMKVLYGGSNTDTQFKINNVSLLDSTAGNGTFQEIDVTTSITSPITSWEVNRNAGNNNLIIAGIFVDGARLVDSGISVTNVPSVASTYRANPTAGTSIVTWTGAANATVAHGLNAAPEMVWTKSRTSSVSWRLWSAAFPNPATNYLGFDNAGMGTFAGTYWGGMNSLTIGLGDGTYDNNTGDMVAYCFAPVEGFSSFGSFEGNGNADGPFISTGFRPRFILMKNIDNAGSGYDWFVFDTARDTLNVSEKILLANTNDAESNSDTVDILSNGFKIRTTANGVNLNSHTIVYAAFAEHPFKIARAR